MHSLWQKLTWNQGDCSPQTESTYRDTHPLLNHLEPRPFKKGFIKQECETILADVSTRETWILFRCLGVSVVIRDRVNSWRLKEPGIHKVPWWALVSRSLKGRSVKRVEPKKIWYDLTLSKKLIFQQNLHHERFQLISAQIGLSWAKWVFLKNEQAEDASLIFNPLHYVYIAQ